MIKLTVIDSAQQTTVHRFDHKTLVIGSETSSSADLRISEENLEERHVEISYHAHSSPHFFISNLAHDPFVTLNGLPFGKRPLQPNDLIQIGNSSVRFELETMTETPPSQPQETPSKEEAVSTTIPKKEINTHIQKPSLKDYYLSEYDDVGEKKSKGLFPLNQELIKKWHLFFKLLATSFVIILIIASLAYLWISDQSGEEEISASKGIADVAMALTYAQIKHIQPKNQNWADPEFIKKNLTAVLAPEFNSWAEFDKLGQFANCPYMLRIYTSQDLSQFLVIAQPVPSLLHWLVPKATIMIDSRAMEMRRMHDLKTLNRLLINSAIDGAHSTEISSLIQQGELIPLTHLNDKKDNQGFSPPKALALIRPGAENRVYNSPRYYSFGQSLLKRALELVEKTASGNEVALFQQELALLNKLPNFILYSSEGLHHATQSQKILSALAPREKFLIAYLQKTSKGKISNARILMDDLSSEISMSESPVKLPHQEKPLFLEEANETNTTAPHTAVEQQRNMAASYGIEADNPLFLRLSALISARYQALKQPSDELVSFLQKHHQTPQTGFSTTLFERLEQYIKVDEEQHKKLINELGTIIRDNSNLPATRFLDFIKGTELTTVLQDYLKSIKQQSLVEIPTKNQFEEQIQQIEISNSLQELEQNAVQIASKLNFEEIPDEEILVAYQNTMRSKVIQKLNEFLLSDHALSPEAFSPECRQMLTHILESAWIVDPDTYDFYLSEFELRTSPK